MNRRQFFQRFAAVPIAASVVIPELTRTIFLPPRDGWPLGLRYKAHERYSAGFTDPRGVYAYEAKELGKRFWTAYSPGVRRYGNRLITAEEFSRIIKPELDRIFAEAYAQHSQEWLEVFR